MKKIWRNWSPLHSSRSELDQQHLPKYQEVIVPRNRNVSTRTASLMRNCLEGSAGCVATGVKLSNIAICRRGEAATLALKYLLTRGTDVSKVLNPVKYSMFSSSSGVASTVSRAGKSTASKLPPIQSDIRPGNGRETVLLRCGVHQLGNFWACVLLHVGSLCCAICVSARHGLRLDGAISRLRGRPGSALAALLGCTFGRHLVGLSSIEYGV